ncbi:MAG: hypothetical protein M1812_003809 [Candelaria pacifica]|nr:MAG: hypothetical protein M1812_003809 [Candelaria pacifica]
MNEELPSTDRAPTTAFDAAYSRLIKASGETKIPTPEIERRFTRLYQVALLEKSNCNDDRSTAERFDEIYTSLTRARKDSPEKKHTVPIKDVQTLPYKSTSRTGFSDKDSGQEHERVDLSKDRSSIPTNSSHTDPRTSKTTSSSPSSTKTSTKAAASRHKLCANSTTLSRNTMNPDFQFSDEEDDL